MEEMFIQVLKWGMSVTWFVVMVTLLRMLLKKAPRGIICVMWYMVWLRLIFPFHVESRFSLAPDMSGIAGYMESRMETEAAGLSVNETEYGSVNRGEGESVAGGAAGQSAMPVTDVTSTSDFAGGMSGFDRSALTNAVENNHPAGWIRIGAVIWLTGAVFMLGYMVISYTALRRKLRTAVLYKENIKQSEFIDSPFIFGIVRPVIYIPYGLEGAVLDHVLAHEKVHLARRDHLTKLLAFTLLGIYWFHPLIWLSYVLFCRDMEVSCDERTIDGMGEKERMAYALTLLSINGRARVFDICPVGFGELGVKERILRIKRYKKPAFGIVLGAGVICVLAAVFFLTSPKQEAEEPALPVSSYYYTDYWKMYDMSDSIFPNKESLEHFASYYLKEVENVLDYRDWWKKINPQAKELQITYYMQDANICKTSIPMAFGEDSVAVNITLSKSMLQNPDWGSFCEDAKLVHEFGHVVLNNSFSISLEDGMCQYLDDQISPYAMGNSTGIPYQDLFCLDIQYAIEMNVVSQTELDKLRVGIGKEGRAYPYAENSSDSKQWYSMSFSFVNYLIDTYGLPDVVELLKEGESQADYEKYLGHSLEELKEDWWNYVINYQSEYSLEDIRNVFEGRKESMS